MIVYQRYVQVLSCGHCPFAEQSLSGTNLCRPVRPWSQAPRRCCLTNRHVACIALQLVASKLTKCEVRHEAAEALGAIASDSTIQMLKDFAKDPEPIVAHSCVVALDMLEFEKSGNFQYAQ
eukprot:scaffold5205_cov20-Tisochrysis_lutea.AAC.3